MNYQEETLNIDTPENVAFGYSVAGIGSRFLAALMDTILIFIIQVLVMLPLLIFIGRDALTKNFSTWVAALLSLLAFVFFWGYYIFFELLWNGQSPGKRMVGLRVVRRDGTPVTFPDVLIRNLLRVIDLLPSAYGVGLVTMFLDARSRRLGDMAAGTLVVHDRGPISLEDLAPITGQIALAGLPSEQDGDGALGALLERLTAQDLQLVEEYGQRRLGLANSDLLAQQILKKLGERAGLNVEAYLDKADYTLTTLANAAVRRRAGRKPGSSF